METEELTIRVSPEAARVYRESSEQQRLKFDLLMQLQLSPLSRPRKSLKELMKEARREAKNNGLTEEILQQILDED